ncbi:uncharacterized protein LOC103967904 isoform X1 [Pyrus x bretschneideri]|uniref:uncharacterized protein LOC103967904 isoform X1 n=1 Tax=Pyrus x bretschneideri TaxID=225117 RepID=UPI00051104AA|nr:uncharacterized protein LOC103967904 isoform X1 [Pyrus x bretschneideri]
MSSTSLLPINGGLLFTQSSSFPNHHRPSAPLYNWSWRRHQGGSVVAYRTNGSALQLLANPNVSSKKGASNNEVIMVDPLEAKRLAAKQMEEIKAKEKYKRKRQIEAINGAWAMIGLTAGLLIEAQTGKSIPTQLVDYWSVIVDIFVPETFSLQLVGYWRAIVDMFMR